MPIGVAKECHPFLFPSFTELSLVVPKYDLGFLLKFDGMILQ